MTDQKDLTKEEKVCETCGTKIPLEFVNPLCWDCYDKLEKAKKAPKVIKDIPAPKSDIKAKNGVREETYIENPEMEDKEQWEANIGIFKSNGVMLWKPTRQIYTFIKDYNLAKIQKHPQYPKFIWKPKIVDVGCGAGIGANVLSQEADFVWGIDKNEKSIRFAKECFTRVKNQIYYSPQVTFDQIDILDDTRDFAQFDHVVAIEIIEHIDDYKSFLRALTKFDKKDKRGNPITTDPTEYWISTPNRHNDSIANNRPRNKYHVREWTSAEFYDVLSDYFQIINFYNHAGGEIPKEEYRVTTHTPLLARASIIK